VCGGRVLAIDFRVVSGGFARSSRVACGDFVGLGIGGVGQKLRLRQRKHDLPIHSPKHPLEPLHPLLAQIPRIPDVMIPRNGNDPVPPALILS